jgi:hypothetical protein
MRYQHHCQRLCEQVLEVHLHVHGHGQDYLVHDHAQLEVQVEGHELVVE